jgi:subtilisin family serine protease
MRAPAVFAAVVALLLCAALPAASRAAPGTRQPKVKAPKTAVRPASVRRRAKITATPNDPLWRSEWGPRLVRMPAVWQVRSSRHVVIAVLDTGVDARQPDLRGVVVPGWNALDATVDANDDGGHGTMVAGVIAARANNGLGVAGYCRECSVMPVKVLDGGGSGTSATVSAGIDWAVAHGADVINLSLVLAARDMSVSAAVARALSAGVVVVASAGNDGGAVPAYPAAEPGVISVAGEDPTRAFYAWSATGAWVTTAAPGCNQSTALGGAFAEFCGTSSATAAVSGIVGAALARRAASPAEMQRAVAAASTGSAHAIDAAAVASALAAR